MKNNPKGIKIKINQKDSEFSIVKVNDAWMFQQGLNAGNHNWIFMGDGKVINDVKKKRKV